MAKQPFARVYDQNIITAVAGVFYLKCPFASCQITDIQIFLGSAVASGSAIFNLRKNGSAQFSGGDRMTIAAGAATASKSGLSIPAVNGDLLTVDIDQINPSGLVAPISILVTFDDLVAVGKSVEEIQDIVGAMILTGGNVTWTYDDAAGTLVASVAAGLTTEQVQDIIGSMVTAGTNSAWTYDDAAGTLRVDAPTLTDEQLQDKIATWLAGTGATSVNYNDTTGIITINSVDTDTNTGLTAEQVMDTVAAMLAQGSNVTLTYNDAGDSLTIAASVGGSAMPAGDLNETTNKLEKIHGRELVEIADLPALGDTFAGSAVDSSIWEIYTMPSGTAPTVGSNKLSLKYGVGGVYVVSNRLTSLNSFAFPVGSYFQFKIENLSYVVPFNIGLRVDDNNRFEIKKDGNNFYLWQYLAGSNISLGGLSTASTNGLTIRVTRISNTQIKVGHSSNGGSSWLGEDTRTMSQTLLDKTDFKLTTFRQTGGNESDVAEISNLVTNIGGLAMTEDSLLMVRVSDGKITKVTKTALGTSVGAAKVRANVAFVTGSLAQGNSATGTITIDHAFAIYQITTNRAARVRLYSTDAARIADQARGVGTDPTGEHGLIAEVVTTALNLTVDMAPMAFGADLKDTPDGLIPIAVTNHDAVTGSVTVTIKKLKLEG